MFNKVRKIYETKIDELRVENNKLKEYVLSLRASNPQVG